MGLRFVGLNDAEAQAADGRNGLARGAGNFAVEVSWGHRTLLAEDTRALRAHGDVGTQSGAEQAPTSSNDQLVRSGAGQRTGRGCRREAGRGGKSSEVLSLLQRAIAAHEKAASQLVEQLKVKDDQIAALNERLRESNLLMGSPQKQLPAPASKGEGSRKPPRRCDALKHSRCPHRHRRRRAGDFPKPGGSVLVRLDARGRSWESAGHRVRLRPLTAHRDAVNAAADLRSPGAGPGGTANSYL